jgi:hypothetical protein
MTAQRACPHCGAANALDLGRKCVRCKKRPPLYCFSCYTPVSSEKDTACAACGRRRWVFGDEAQLRCIAEPKAGDRIHGYMTTRAKDGKVVHEWRCLNCFAQDLLTDAFSHFPSS